MKAMTGDESGKNQKKSSATNRRDARLAAALRENLRRRKAQERARGADERARGANERARGADERARGANERARGAEERGREAQVEPEAEPGDEPEAAPPPPNGENR
jgi:hypothetical protein